ncbi:two-component system, OmpR family, heavy metal sensor histidine kinase CusS [Rhodocyclaceae bacterium]|nr:two-component system, OmpR family, heavy metal sensor histidine kinase CusS [Rhodocyclaceae bacterium]
MSMQANYISQSRPREAESLNVLPKSIALRLTLTLGAVGLVVLSAAGLLLHRALADELSRSDHDELIGKVRIVKHFIGEAGKSGDITVLRHHMDDMLLGHGNLKVWLVGAEGGIVYGGPLPRVVGLPDKRGQVPVQLDDVPMDAIESVIGNPGPFPIARAWLAVDTRPRDKLLATYRVTIMAVCALGVATIVGLGGIAIWRGLRPVNRLSAEALRITPHSLDARLSDTHDDTELTGLVEAFNGVLDRLEAAYHQMEHFSADVAHELRTPLATLISGSQVMLSGDRGKDELRDVLASHLEELEQMKVLVNDMLFLARADQGDRAQDLTQVQLGREVDKTIRYCEPLIDEAGVEVRRSGDAAAVCSAPLVLRAMTNLLVNAIKHTERGQTITLCIEPHADRVRLYVSNPGSPIPVHLASRMFDRFFRGDEARTRAGESHGLGLAIVRAVARMHGGGVFVDSDGRVNRVGFDIPVSRATPAVTNDAVDRTERTP